MSKYQQMLKKNREKPGAPRPPAASQSDEFAVGDDMDLVGWRKGMVIRKSQGQYTVLTGERSILCTISNRLRKRLIYPIADPGSLHARVVAVEDIRMVDPIAVGDGVQFVDANDGSGAIVEVLPRRSKLVRRAAGPKPLEQVIVANVDQVVVICAADRPAPSWELVDRYLASAESTDVPARICITKMDLVEPGVLDEEVANYRAIGYPVDLTSASSGAGVAAFAGELQQRLSVLAGKSGAGKTSILNAIQPGLGLRVGAVSTMTGKGKHTTSYLELFPLADGGGVIDTPGMREFGLWDVHEDDIAPLFREFRPFVGKCRFGASCRHRDEPGCAITAAVAAGRITPRRYHSYRRMTS
jgi:ribosome biogenesis GTPase / thiamine phosphate phosphatase